MAHHCNEGNISAEAATIKAAHMLLYGNHALKHPHTENITRSILQRIPPSRIIIARVLLVAGIPLPI